LVFVTFLFLALSGCTDKKRVALIQESKLEDAKLSAKELDKKYSVLLGQVVEFSGDESIPLGVGVKSLQVYPAGSLEEQNLQMPHCESKRRQLRIEKNIKALCLSSESVSKILRPFNPQPPYTIKPVQP
jgi:hypothetical protein